LKITWFQSMAVVAGRDTQHGNAAAVIHGAQHLAQRHGVARHFEAHVEAFFHAEIFHGLVQGFARHVEAWRRPSWRRELEAVVVHVGDDHVARAAVTRNGHGHDADGAGAGDEHVLADHIEGERGVRGVAERIEMEAISSSMAWAA
jgi:hypothetical protein